METGEIEDDVATAPGETVAPDVAATPPEPASMKIAKSLGERAVLILPGVRENFIARLTALMETVQRCLDEGMDHSAVYDAMERTCKLLEPPFSTYDKSIASKIFYSESFPDSEDQYRLDEKLKNNLHGFATSLFLQDRTVRETLAAMQALVTRIQGEAGFIDYIDNE